MPWPAISAVGNIVRREYQRVEPRLVWNIAEQHLALLSAAIDRFVEDLNRQT